MTVEVLFGEVANLCGDHQNMTYLRQSAPNARFVETSFLDTPYFAENDPDFIYMGAMTEDFQRRIIEKLRPYKERLLELAQKGTVMLFTGNAGETLFSKISYVTEEKETEGLGIFDLTVKTDLFNRYNGKNLGSLAGEDKEKAGLISGFRSQFSRWYGNNEKNAFLNVIKGMGLNEGSKLEGVRLNNLICTSIIGPILPLNPLFTEYLMRLAGCEDKAAHREAAVAAWEERVKEMEMYL